ncbi:MAG: hypothetical protein II567_05580 [Candidatus Riflebacteria bacterium]|jgi:hypothetical protein|nr:hypothetical protein [Candidatus Riflebacteria bacterium]
MKRLLIIIFLVLASISIASAQNMLDLDCEMLLEKVTTTASKTYDCSNYKTNLVAVYIASAAVDVTNPISIKFEGSVDNATYTPITYMNITNNSVDASGTVKVYNGTVTDHTDKFQINGAKYFRVIAEYTGTATANITVTTVKGGKIISY